MPINNPRDISGLVAWYSAEAETGYADNAQMTSWTDLSGNGNHATGVLAGSGTTKPLWRSAGGPGGGPSVEWPYAGESPNGGYFTMPDVMGAAAAGEVMAYLTSLNTRNGLWSLSAPSTIKQSHYPYDGVVYDSFGSTTRQSFTPTLAVTSWRRYNVWSAANDWAARLDETTQVTSAANTTSWDATPWLGRGDAAAEATSFVFSGRMSAVVLYNRKLTTTERDDLAAWLTANPSGGALAGVSVPVAAAVTDWVTPPVSIPIHTDNSNGMGGWQLGGYATARVTTPVAADPFPGGEGHKPELAKYLPPPTIENGEIK